MKKNRIFDFANCDAGTKVAPLQPSRLSQFGGPLKMAMSPFSLTISGVNWLIGILFGVLQDATFPFPIFENTCSAVKRASDPSYSRIQEA